MVNFGFGLDLESYHHYFGGEFTPAPPYVPPPNDWRMVASVTTSAGLSGDVTALNNAQSAASSKTRPAVALPSGVANWIEYSIAASATPIILSWLGLDDSDTTAIAINGVDQGFTYPNPMSVSDLSYRRQAVLIPASASARTIRISFTPATARTLRPLMHQTPASGKWDSHIFFGASREDLIHDSLALETDLIATYPTRDPLVFSGAKSGAELPTIAAYSSGVCSQFNGIVCYAHIGSAAGNYVSNYRPYTTTQGNEINGHYDTLVGNIKAANMAVYIGNLSYRAYPETEPLNDANGSRPYNDGQIHASVIEHAPHCYDTGLLRSRIDEYILTQRYRTLLSDTVHPEVGQEILVRELWVNSAFRHIYTNSWNGAQIAIEDEMQLAETTLSVSEYTEALQCITALATSAAKTAYLARLAAIEPDCYYNEAEALVVTAETLETQAAVDNAQYAIDGLAAHNVAAGDIQDLQDRIDAIVVASIVQEVWVNIGTSAEIADTRWRPFLAAKDTSLTNPNNIAGSASGLTFAVTTSSTATTTTAGMATSSMADFPAAVLVTAVYRLGTWTITISGCNATHTYDILLTGSRAATASTRATKYVVQGVTLSPDIEANGNTSDFRIASGVVPDGSNNILVSVQNGTGSSYAFLNGLKVIEKS